MREGFLIGDGGGGCIESFGGLGGPIGRGDGGTGCVEPTTGG
jgi:hypothetical protein